MIDTWLQTGQLKVSHTPWRFPFERFRKVRSASIEGHGIIEAMLRRPPAEGGSVLTASELYKLNSDPAALDVEKWITRCIKRLTEPTRGLSSFALVTYSQCHMQDLAGRCRGLTFLKLRCGAVMQMGADYERTENERLRAFEREEAADPSPIYTNMSLAAAFSDECAHRGDDAYLEREDHFREHVGKSGGALDDISLCAVLAGCSQLVCLDLSTPDQSWKMTNAEAKSWAPTAIRRIEWGVDDEGVGCGDGITGAGVQEVPNLEVLNLIGCRNISDEGLQVICSGCPKLRCLRIGGSEIASEGDCAITDAGMLSLATLTKLEELCVVASGSMDRSNISAAAFVEVLEGCKALRKILVIKDQSAIDNGEDYKSVPVFAAFQPIEGKVPVVPNLTTLIVDTVVALPAHISPLSFSGCSSLRVFRCSLDVTTRVGADEGASCGKLLSVLASNCHQIEVIAVNRADDLQAFREDNNSIDDTVLSLLAAGCQQLEELAIERYDDSWRSPSSAVACCPVTDSGLLTLLSACKKLKIVTLPPTDKVTDFGMYHVSQKAVGLKVLRARSTCVTMAGVCLVLQACCKLETLQVTTAGFANPANAKWREAIEAQYGRIVDLQ